MKKIIPTILFLLTLTNIFSQNKYTVSQVMDSLSKYENPFDAFEKLDYDYIPYDSIRNNPIFKEKSLELFNRDIYIEWRLETEKKSLKDYFYDFSKESLKINYYEKKSQLFMDSIYKNKTIRFRILDSIYSIHLNEKEKKYKNYKYVLDSDYMSIHSKLFYQEAYDKLREYYDKKHDANLVIQFDSRSSLMLALINLGDPKVRKVFDNYFEEKAKKKEFLYYDIIDIKHFITSYKYEKYLALLNYTYKVGDGMSHGEAYHPMRCYIAEEYFPNTYVENILDWKTSSMIKDKMLGNKILYTSDCKPTSSWKTVKEYFQKYIDYEKESENYNLLKYKN